MPMPSRLLSRALQLSEAGKQDDARRLLQAVIQQDPHNERAWFGYVRTLESVEERLEALRRYLRIEPANRRTQEVLWMLWEQRCSAAPAEPRAPPRSGRVFYVPLLLVALVVLVAGIVYVRQEVLERWANRFHTLLEQHDRLLQDYGDLNLEHDALRVEFEGLGRDHEALVADHEALAGQHATLRQEYEGLAAQHSRLQQDYDGLLAEHDTLLSEHQALQGAHDSLTAQYDWLNTNALIPPYISVNGREVYIAFLRTDASVEHWEVPFESLEKSIQMGTEKRQGSIWARTPTLLLESTATGETYTVWDYRAFVNPGPFRRVMGELYAEAASEYDFIYETWHIVAQLTAYSEDLGETPRYPLETFLAGGGDCEDTSILFASMIKAAPVDWEVQLVYMDMDYPEEPRSANHVIVAVNTGTESYLIETTSDYEMEPFDGVRGWYFDVE